MDKIIKSLRKEAGYDWDIDLTITIAGDNAGRERQRMIESAADDFFDKIREALGD